MRLLFLDDIRQPSQCLRHMKHRVSPGDLGLYASEWHIVRNYKEFCAWINKNGIPNVVSFDHDLADAHYDPSTWRESFQYQEETGLDCAKYLWEYCQAHHLEIPKYIVHSQNPVGTENITKFLARCKHQQSK